MAGRWQDLQACDRCGHAATVKATKEKETGIDGEPRKILLCPEHIEPHEESLKKQGFVLTVV